MRRPSIRSLAGGAAGIVVGVTGGVVLTAVSAAGPVPAAQRLAVIDAAHVPPLLRLPGEPVRLRYALACTPRDDGRPCEGSGTVYVRAGGSRDFRAVPLARDDDSSEGRYYADIPAFDASGTFAYYAILRDDTTGAAVTVPSGGAAAPHVSVPLRAPIDVPLGVHVFGNVREPDVRVAEASWGAAPQDVGLEGSRALGFTGPSSFDVEPDGTVDVLDSVRRRVLRWNDGFREAVPLGGATELADFAATASGGFDVLDVRGALRRYAANGRPQWTQKLSDRTWVKLERTSAGPLVLQEPSEQWMPLAAGDAPRTRTQQASAARAGKPLANGHEVLIDHVAAYELRVAQARGDSPLRAWRIRSATPLGEVQLAELHGDELVLVTRVYTDDQDEFLVLFLGRSGLERSFSVASDSWTETAPLARFRLARDGLYRLRTTVRGVAVDRFELEVPR